MVVDEENEKVLRGAKHLPLEAMLVVPFTRALGVGLQRLHETGLVVEVPLFDDLAACHTEEDGPGQIDSSSSRWHPGKFSTVGARESQPESYRISVDKSLLDR
jgi:hypothetical protein